MDNIVEINELRNTLMKQYINIDRDFCKKFNNIKFIEEKKDKHDIEFYYKTLKIDNLIFYYINFDNKTEKKDHYLNINTYKIHGPNKNEKISEKYKNNISFLYDEMNFKTITENMFIEFINIVLNFMKI
jgi:hypothetical protein